MHAHAGGVAFAHLVGGHGLGEQKRVPPAQGSTTSGRRRATLPQVMPEKLPCDQLCRLTMLESCAKATTISVMAEQM